MSIYFQASFTGTAGTDVLSYTPEVGTSFSTGYFNGLGAASVVLDGKGSIYRSVNLNSNLTQFRCTTNPLPVTDYTVSATFTQLSSQANCHPGLITRYQTTKECYKLVYNSLSFGLYYQNTSGTSTQIGANLGALGVGVCRNVSMTVSGTSVVTINVSVGGVVIMNYKSDGTGSTGSGVTFTAITSAGTAGIHYDSGNDIDSPVSTGYRVGAFIVYDGTLPSATGYTITGPSGGFNSVLNGPFVYTLYPAGYAAPSTTLTLSDGSLGGTFYQIGDYRSGSGAITTLTTATLSTAAPSVTVNYRLTTTGTASIGATNNTGLTDATALSYPVVNDAAGTLRICMMGDSNTDIAQSSASTIWLQKYLQQYGINSSTPRPVFITNLGISGQFSSTFAAPGSTPTPTIYLAQNIQIFDLYKGVSPAIALWSYMIGTNDVTSSTTPSVYKSNVKSTAKYILDHGDRIIVHYPPQTTLYSAGVYMDVNGLLPQFCTQVDALTSELNTAGYNYCYKGNDTYYFLKANDDNTTGLFATAKVFTSGVQTSGGDKHFSQLGYQMITAGEAAEIYRQILAPVGSGGSVTIIGRGRGYR